jgi:hypothetical protein
MLESARGTLDEWSGIQWVAVNRARNKRASVRDVVATTSWPGGGARGRAFVEAVQAPGGQGYRSAFGHPAPPDVNGYARALGHARALLLGQVPNPIGLRTHFLHPAILPACAGDEPREDGRLCVDGRAYPKWSVSRARGGSAEHEPMRVGRAVFS